MDDDHHHRFKCMFFPFSLFVRGARVMMMVVGRCWQSLSRQLPVMRSQLILGNRPAPGKWRLFSPVLACTFATFSFSVVLGSCWLSSCNGKEIFDKEAACLHHEPLLAVKVFVCQFKTALLKLKFWASNNAETPPPQRKDILPSDEDFESVVKLKDQFPSTSISDIRRFLVARKGNIIKAAEMIENANDWRSKNLPLRKHVVAAAISTNCFFFHGLDREGCPVLYMRGALYDNRVASFESYVLLAAHIIDHVIEATGAPQVTVIVYTAYIPGAPNLDVDTKFIRRFTEVLSDNYPERLKKLIMYPFPWYGHAIWSVVKLFVSPRTQDKVQLYSASTPEEISKFVDPANIPVCVGGKYDGPLTDVMTTFKC